MQLLVLVGLLLPTAASSPAGIAALDPSSHASVQNSAAAALVAQTSASSKLADGTYQGPLAEAYYGTVQVQAIVQNGQIASVRVLKYPADRNTSRYINSQALPILEQEAIQAQSGQVDIVSGATLTSEAFSQSLIGALQEAATGTTSS
jgi:uncharacterized protein with FMN-binding domain